MKSAIVKLSTVGNLGRIDAEFVLAYTEHQRKVDYLVKMISVLDLYKMATSVPVDGECFHVVWPTRRVWVLPNFAGITSSRISVDAKKHHKIELAVYLCLMKAKGKRLIDEADAEVRKAKEKTSKMKAFFDNFELYFPDENPATEK